MENTDLRSGTCPSCGHNEIIEASPKSNNAGDSLGLTHRDNISFVFSSVNQHMVGQLWSYTCRRCGLTEWVVAMPEQVPIGPEHGTRLITGAAPQPFR